MPHQCPACHRANPPQARYCFYDGVALGGASGDGPIRVGSRAFLTPFVFPSGRSCKNFDELMRACEDEWSAARAMLQEGYFVGFLGGLGRADLAQAARSAAREPDADRALDEFLGRLPGERTPPSLGVSPRDVNLGQIDTPQPRAFSLAISNQGAGLLSGTARSEAPWLALGEAPGVLEKHFSCRGEFALPVQLKLAALRAGSKPQEGRVVVTAGNQTVAVTIKATRPVVPFALGKLAGATTPRRLAELARDNARDAAPLFEQGQVARWYESNGWTYPVQGPPAAGLGAVQQYFEALGLAKPPKVRINRDRIEMAAAPGGSAEDFVLVETDEKRAVFARALSEADWLDVAGVKYQANSARVNLRVPCAPLLPGQRLTGKLVVISNGNQRFEVEVALQLQGRPVLVQRPPVVPPPLVPPPQPRSRHDAPPVRHVAVPVEVVSAPAASPYVAETMAGEEYPMVQVIEPELVEPELIEPVLVEPVLVPVESSRRGPTLAPEPPPGVPELLQARGGGFALHAIGPALILLILLGTVLHDLLLPRGGGGSSPPKIDPTPVVDLRFHDGPNGDASSYPERSMTFGVTLRDAGRGKRLMYDDRGRTNNVCLRIDDEDYLFGVPVAFQAGNPVKSEAAPVGAWLNMRGPLGKDKDGRERDGAKSVWRVAGLPGRNLGVDVTQTVEVVPGEQSLRYDTVQVRYEIHNRSTSKERNVGLRFLLDTFIGDNDGVPFTIPGESALCSTKREFDRGRVPDYLLALENADLSRPGTVAQVQLVTAGAEPPSRVLLGGYPDGPLRLLGYTRAQAWFTAWDVPFVNVREAFDNKARIGKLPGGGEVLPDSAVTLYWEPRPLRPGEKREVGFSYGLGEVGSVDGSGRLLLVVGGKTSLGGVFSLTALRRDPVAGERLTLRLPPGDKVRLLSAAEQEVPPVARGSDRPISAVTWRLEAMRMADAVRLEVESSEGLRQKKDVRITKATGGVWD